MKTTELRTNLLKTFKRIKENEKDAKIIKAAWKEFRSLVKEATDNYPITMTWRCIAKGRRRDGKACIFGEQFKADPNITGAYVSEQFTYLRFAGSDYIHRFRNPAQMIEAIKEFDVEGVTDMEEGDVFILEPMTKARSLNYSADRRAAIKRGTWTVTPRKRKNIVRERPPIHHYRPY